MTFLRTTALTSALVLLSGPALAQVSAEQVWQEWKDMVDSYGMSIVTQSETISNGTVSLTGTTFSFEMPEGVVSIDYGDMTFADTGNGTVAITMDDEARVTADLEVEGDEINVSITLSQPSAELIVSGEPDALRYDFAYPAIALTDFTIEGADIPEDLPAEITATASDITGYMALKDSEAGNYDSVLSMGTLVANVRMIVPEAEGGGTVEVAFNMSDLEQTASGALGAITMAMSAADMIEGGMEQESRTTYGPSSYTIDADGPDGAFTVATSAESGTLDVSMSESGIRYGGASNNANVAISGEMIPFPAINLSMAELGGEFGMPLVPSDQPQDFSAVIRLLGLEIDDMIWGMFDPAGQIPRDPANLVVDLAGKATLTEDITSQEFAENPVPGMPGTVEEVKLNALQLSVAGAELTGTGDFTFDNSAGVPMPAGVVDLSLTGSNTLLDTLVGMGLLPEEQAMGARMMLGMFARPGPGEDNLTSQIEMTPDGQILANGQRIR